MNKTCALCINSTNCLYAEHGFDNAFFENTEIYMGKNCAGK